MRYMHEGQKISLDELLKRRDERQLLSDELSNRFPRTPIIYLTVNIPGPVKNNPAIERVFDFGVKAINNHLEDNNVTVLDKKEFRLSTGSEYIVIANTDAGLLKKDMTSIEDSGIGRLLDIDVIIDGIQISRSDLKIEERKCFLCNQNAKLCARSRKHNLDELYIWIEKQIDAHLKD